MMEDNDLEEVCAHCSVPFNGTLWAGEKVYEIICASSSSDASSSASNGLINFDSSLPISVEKKINIYNVLTTIFNLNYIKPLTPPSKRDDGEGQEKENCPMCPNCSRVLTDLYKVYKDFEQLSAHNSFLNKQINKLNDLVYQHESSQDTTLKGMANTSNLNAIDYSTQTPPINVFFHGQPKVTLRRVSQTPKKRIPRKFQRVNYIQESSDDSVGDSNMASPPDPIAGHAIDDDDEDEDITQPINYLDVDIKVEEDDDEWQEPQEDQSPEPVSSSSKTTKSKSTKPKQTRTRQPKLPKGEKRPKKTRKEKSREYDLRDYLIKRSKYCNPCWYCKSLDFPTPAACLEHTEKEHLPEFKKSGKSAAVCDRCAKICLTQLTMKLHKKRCDLIPAMGEIIPKSFTCTEPDCGKSFASKKILKVHIQTHSEERPFSCDQFGCNYKSKTYSALTTHKTYQHPAAGSIDGLQVMCDLCGTTVKNRNSLKAHTFNMHTPHGFRKYNETRLAISARKREETREKKAAASSFCGDCNVDFFTPYGLTMHRKNFHPHEVVQTHLCNICGQSFSAASSLKTHLKVHSDERPFVCEKCGKGFKHNHHLKDHAEQVHTEEGRLKYNEHIRAKVKRRKLLQSQLAQRQHQQQMTQEPNFGGHVNINIEPIGSQSNSNL